MMQVRNPKYKSLIAQLFKQAAFIAEVGVDLVDVGPGWCETELIVKPKHFQQNTFIHAGVQATIADHTAGGAASTLVGEDEFVLTVEFKINFLRAAQGERLRCRAEVLKPGRMFTIVESEVFALAEDKSAMVAKALVTLAVLERTKRERK
jgi:uncharacterized protein (TIGR00369 family)